MLFSYLLFFFCEGNVAWSLADQFLTATILTDLPVHPTGRRKQIG